jgi:hypothetical protein
MSKASRHRDLRAIRNLITQTEDILIRGQLPIAAKPIEVKAGQGVALLRTALALTDDLIAHSAAVDRCDNRRQTAAGVQRFGSTASAVGRTGS